MSECGPAQPSLLYLTNILLAAEDYSSWNVQTSHVFLNLCSVAGGPGGGC